MKKFFVNPGGRRRRLKKKTTARRRRRTPPRGRDGLFISRKGRKATVARKRRTRKRSSARRTTARRRVRNAPRRRLRKSRIVRVRRRTSGGTRTVKRRSYRRNAGILSILMRGLMDAGFVTGGKVATNLATRAIPFKLPLPGIAGDVVKGLGVASVISIAASKLLKGGGGINARMISAGAFQAVLESVLRTVNVPMVSTALGEYDILANNYNGLGNYPRPVTALPAGMGNYPTPQFEGEQFAYDQAG